MPNLITASFEELIVSTPKGDLKIKGLILPYTSYMTEMLNLPERIELFTMNNLRVGDVIRKGNEHYQITACFGFESHIEAKRYAISKCQPKKVKVVRR